MTDYTKYAKASRDYLEAWRTDNGEKQELSDRIAELEAELKECRRTALGDGYERANIEHAGHFAELEAENQRLRDGIANAMLCDSVVQMHECLAALLGGGE